MGYSNYKKLKQVLQKFSLKSEIATLFSSVPDVSASTWLLQTLKLARMMPLTNEKTKSERIVSPIMLEVALAFEGKITLFSGEALDINPEDNLSGECDFFITFQKPSIVFDAPIISIVEAKDEDLEWGIAQCCAQLHASKIFNEREGKHFPTLYGCATDCVEWHFIRYENDTFYLDREPITYLPQILGTWQHIIRLFLDSQET